MGQITLDNPTRGSTTLLAQCVPSSTSSSLNPGTTENDQTGDILFNAVRKLKQDMADSNAMFTDLYGVTNTNTATVPSGASDAYSPGTFTAGVTTRCNWTPTDGTTVINGVAAHPDGWRWRIFNPSSTLPLVFNLGASGTGGDSFYSNASGGATGAQGQVTISPLSGAQLEYNSAIGGHVFL